MIKKATLLILCTTVFYILTECVSTQPMLTGDPSGRTPSAEREFRAAWVASVANINWPSEPGLSVEKQKAEAIQLLDVLYHHHFNAVILQVRPQCDALYYSDLEPWSYYLTGEQGKAPHPFYDPLEFWIKEAHQRGIEVHAWLNPYRAHHTVGGEVTESSIAWKRPDLVVKLENGFWWLDPGLQGTQDHSYRVVMDIVRRYDIDGIHFDDYFYPYPSYNNNKDFPDEKSWRQYKLQGGKLSRDDWRRENVNTFIKRIYKGIKEEKSFVKFGLSPFGIWRPNNPLAISGFDQYSELYADAKLWLNEGWIDYMTPQLYWSINQLPQSYPVLLGWWDSENIKGRHVWPGMSIGRYKGEKAIDETINQIMVTRGMLPESPGMVHWNIGPLVHDPGLANAISEGPYRRPALVPPSPWLSRNIPEPPEVEITFEDDTLKISWQNVSQAEISRWVVYYKHGSSWNHSILGRAADMMKVPAYKLNTRSLTEGIPTSEEELRSMLIPLSYIGVSAVNRFGNESRLVQLPVGETSYINFTKIDRMITEFVEQQKEPEEAKDIVKPGIDVLIDKHLDLIRGKKVGLITNPSAVGRDLRSSIDILAEAQGVNLAALFGAEHGVRGAKQGKIFREGEPDPRTGIPVYSLYGDSYAPKSEWLDELDVLIFDIQGVGSSWYTFKYSMSFAMQACAQSGIEFMVLDRPNPLGGLVVEGPNLDLGGIFRHPLPLRHGMTYGELARMWNETEGFYADLTVVEMEGWNRNMTWDQTGLYWVMPSPNMGTLETAIVYPGQCLFERSNISEARGTTKPFLLTGAPWIDPEAAARDLNGRGIDGALFRPVYFIPKNGNPGSNPRGKPWNRMCRGVEIILTDFQAYRSVETALHILDAYRKTNPDSLVWSPPGPVRLLDEPGNTVEDVIAACEDDIREFVEIRNKYLIY